jgi:hypothetical protein
MQLPFRCRSGFVVLSLSIGVLAQALALAAAKTSRPTAIAPAPARAEVRRGAAEITAIRARKYPYGTAYRLMRACLEKNAQERDASDAFLVGAHLTIAFWLADLPQDVTWREKAFARHRDVAEWLLPHVGLPPKDIAHLVVRAARLPPAAEQRLLDLIGHR